MIFFLFQTKIKFNLKNLFLFQNITVTELDRLLGIVVDVENLFMCVHKEEDADTKQVNILLRLG